MRDQIQEDIRQLRDDVDALRQEVEKKYVTKDEFRPIRLVVYGAVALILAASFSQILTKANVGVGLPFEGGSAQTQVIPAK